MSQKNIFIPLACCFSFLLNAQISFPYIPLADQAENQDSIIADINTKLQKDLSKLPEAYHNIITDIYKERTEGIIYALEEGHYLFDEAIMNWLREISRRNFYQ